MAELDLASQGAGSTGLGGARGRRSPSLPARLLAAGVLVLSLGPGCDGPRPAPDEGERPKSSGVATPALKVGDQLPPLVAEGWVNGNPPAPDAPGVKLLVVDAWGLWCPHCGMSAPGLVRVHEKYSGQGVAFVSITNSERVVVENFVRHNSVSWPSGYGASVQMVAALGAGSGMPGPPDYEIAPTLYLVGPDGRVKWVDGRGRYRHQRPQDWVSGVDAAIAEALAPPQPKP